MSPSDTIAAISSAVGPAARMIVRLSGPLAPRLAAELTYATEEPRAGATRTRLHFQGLALPAWLYVFRAPRSYTGDDLVEFHLPGNPLLARMLLDHLRAAGARDADPGEFTARAFFNGRLDLTEAEGVAATIAAGNEAELAAARQLMAGELARRLRPVIDSVAETLALVEAGIDFSDEDVTFLSPDQIRARADEATAALDSLLSDSTRFERLAHEPTAVLFGRPNAGKSTLLNALSGTARAVTSPAAGTTRDVLSAPVALERGIVRVLDVAGLEEEERNDDPHPPSPGTPGEGRGEGLASSIPNPKSAIQNHDGPHPAPLPEYRERENASIAAEMRRRALRAVEEADVLVLVHDATEPQPPPDVGRRPDVTVFAKADLPGAAPPAQPGPRSVFASAVTGRGLADVRAALDDAAFGTRSGSATLALNARHVHAVTEAKDALALVAAAPGAPAEVVALELREALDALGRVLGAVTPDDLLGRIFSTFCIGK